MIQNKKLIEPITKAGTDANEIFLEETKLTKKSIDEISEPIVPAKASEVSTICCN